MPLKDPLLDCLNEMSLALQAELKQAGFHTYSFEHPTQGKRWVCDVCGVSFADWEREFTYRHQEWCRVGKILLLIERAKTYIP